MRIVGAASIGMAAGGGFVKMRFLQSECQVARGREEVFAFFADPSNLALLTPPSVRVEIPAGGPKVGRAGLEFEYRVRVRGLPMRWRGRFEVWEAPERFVDVQLRGPYRRWRHEHAFEELGDGWTRVIDRVEYAVWGGGLVDRWIVRPEMERMFAYRATRLSVLFPPAG